MVFNVTTSYLVAGTEKGCFAWKFDAKCLTSHNTSKRRYVQFCCHLLIISVHCSVILFYMHKLWKLSWLGFPPHVQMSSLRFSCFCMFWPHCTCSYTCVRAAARDCFLLFSAPLCAFRSNWPTCARCWFNSDVHGKRANATEFKCICRQEQTSYEYSGRRVELTEVVWCGGVTTSCSHPWSGPPSTVNCRHCEAELDSGRRADEATLLWVCNMAERRRRSRWLPAAPFHDAVVFETGAVMRRRCQDAPTSRLSRRRRADPGVVRDQLLTNHCDILARYCASFHVAAYVLCLICCQLPLFFLFSWPATSWGLTLLPY